MGKVNGFFTEFWCCEEEQTDTVCVTVALKGGFIKSIYLCKDTEEIVEINSAAGSVFMYALNNRIKIRNIEGIRCTTGKNGVYITITAEKENIAECLESVMRIVFEKEVTEVEFEEAKKQTIDKLRQNFKNEAARSWYYMFEFTEMGKGYTYNRLAKSLETITYEEFHTYTEALVNPMNSIVIVNGTLEQTEVTSICCVLKSVRKAGKEYVDYGYVLSEDGILDCHLLKKCNSIGALYVVFPDYDVTPTEKMFLLMYINEIMFRNHGVVSVDTFDASITYFQEPIKKYELEMDHIWTKENVERAKERLLQYFENLIRKPTEFGVYIGEMLFSGVDIYKLIRDIQICDFDIVYRAYKNADIKVSSAAIINEGGRKDGRRTGIKTN